MKLLFENVKKNKIHLLRAAVLLACIVLMYIVWEMYIDDFSVREEFVIEAGETENVSMPFQKISGLAVSLEDIQNGYTNEKYLVSLSLAIEDSNDEKIWEAECGQVELTTFAFVSIENLPDMPLSLNENEKYTLKCWLEGEQTDGITYAVFGEEKTIGTIYLGCCIVAMLLLCVILWWSQIRLSFCWKFAIVSILLGMLYNIAFVPLCVPDEMYHFAQAYANSNRILGKPACDESGRVIFSDSGMLRLELCQHSKGQGVYRFWNNWQYGNEREEAVSTKFYHSRYLKQYVYIPAAAIISLMRLIKAPYQIVFLSGQMANFAFFILIMVLSMKLCPKLTRAIAAIGFLPCTIWLAASYSYDAWNLGLCVLFFSYCMYCRDQKKKTGWKNVAVLCAVYAILAPIKIVYALIGASVLFIPKDKFKNIYYQAFSYMLVAFSGIITLTIGSGRTGAAAVNYVTTQNQDVRSVVEGREGYSLSWVLNNPVHTIKVYINTLIEKGEQYIYTAVAGDFFYYEISSLLIYAILFIFLLIMANELHNNRPAVGEKIVAGGIFIVGAVAVLTAFLFSYSVIHVESIGTISGVQGRYFMPFFIFLPIILQSKIIRIEGREITLLKCMAVMNAVCMWCNFARLIR